MDLSNVKSQALAFGGGLLAGITVNTLINKMSKGKKNILKSPEKWMKAGTVSKLIIYPVKSMRGIEVNEAEITPLGLSSLGSLRDRVFAVANEKGVLLSSRRLPLLMLIQPSVNDRVLTLFSNVEGTKGNSLSIPFPSEDSQKSKLVRIWGDRVPALDCGDEVADWLSNVTNTPGLRLFYYALNVSKRKLTAVQAYIPEMSFPMFSASDLGAFQDETSYMLMTEESLEFLNSNLDSPLTERSFRPTILVKDSPEPWAEDLWSFIRFGDKVNGTTPILKASEPCMRCKVTTINPDTAVINKDGEPVKTLRKLKHGPIYEDEKFGKMVENYPIMGTHFGFFEPDTGDASNRSVKVGDSIYVAVL